MYRWLILLLFIGTIGYTDETVSSDLPGEPFVYTDWDSFTVKSTEGGLPNDHIFAVKADGNRVWVGTEDGLAMYENGHWKHWKEEDGLPWRVVTGITVDHNTGDVWLALFGGGVARFSAGRFDHFHQLNSGLVNDVVYGVAMQDEYLWAATTAGTSRYNTVTKEWDIFTEKNAPMEEIWCYGVDSADGKVYLAVWGGGVLEWDVATEEWKDYRDPDHEMEIDLYRDDGLIHIITTMVSYVEKTLWVSTYFGFSRYDGRHWRGYMDHDSGLASNFVNFTKGKSSTEVYNCTDKGLSVLVQFPQEVWVNYVRENEDDKTWTAQIVNGTEIVRRVPTNITLPNHFVICADFQGDDVWMGTGKGLAHGHGSGYWDGLKPVKTAMK